MTKPFEWNEIAKDTFRRILDPKAFAELSDHMEGRSQLVWLPRNPGADELALVPFPDEGEPDTWDWLWELRLVSGRFNILVGLPGRGKSYIALDIAARITTGAPWPDGSGRPNVGRVVILGTEDDPGIIRDRLVAQGANMDNVQRIVGEEHIMASNTSRLDFDFSKLDALLYEYRPSLVVFDPVLDVASTRFDPNKDNESRAFLRALGGMAERSGACFLGIMHFNKKIDLDPIQRVPGSAGWGGYGRSVLFAEVDEKDPDVRFFGPIKMNYGQHPAAMQFHVEAAYPGATDTRRKHLGVLKWDGQVDASQALQPTPKESERAETLLNKVLQPYSPETEGVPATRLEEERMLLGISTSTMERTRKQLEVVSKRTKDSWLLWLPAVPSSP